MEEKTKQAPKAIVKKKIAKYGGQNSEGLKKAMGSRWGGGFSFNFSSIRERVKELENNKRKNKEMGFIANKEVFGNDLSGEQWVDEQKKRRQQDEIYSDKEHADEKISEEDQIIYIEASASEKRLEQLRKMGRPFYDQIFPPNDYSLTGAFGYISSWEPIEWAKLSANIKGAKIFEGKVQPCDIMQGFLGDCYFLAGLAALAERPDRIYNIFLLEETNEINYFSVKIIYRGKWRTVDVDQYIPFAYGTPAFSKSKNKQLWVMILEKAWAKLYGSYKQLQGGFPQQPLHDLTGAPIKQLFLQDKSGQNEWEYLYDASIKQYAMVASSLPGSDTEQSQTGIFFGHAYTFLNATQIEYKGKKDKVVQLRNPWGQGQFKGRWSDLDPVWNEVTEAEKNRVGFKKNSNDGVFFMSFQDFMYEFRNVTVAEINDNASYVYDYFVDPQANGAYFTIEVKTPAKYSLHIDKTPQRSFTGQMQNRYQYPQSSLDLGSIEQGTNRVKKQRGFISKRRTLFKSYDLQPGKYIAYVKVDFDPNFQKDYEVVLAVYSEYPCKIRLSTIEESKIFSGGQETGWIGRRYREDELPPPRSRDRNAGQRRNNRLKDFTAGQQLKNTKKETTGTNIQTPKKQEPKKIISQEITSPKNIITKQAQKETRIDPITGKKKKIRRIQKQTVKHQVTEESPNGEAVVNTHENQIKTESVERNINGGKNIKTKRLENTIDTTEHLFEGELIKKNEKFKEVVKIIEETPDGIVKEKVSSKEKELETMEEDDDGTDSYMISEAEKAENGGEIEDSEFKKAQAIASFNKGGESNVRKDDDLKKRDVLRYPDDDEDDE